MLFSGLLCFSFLFSLFFLILPLFLSVMMIPLPLVVLYYSQLPPFILSAVTRFTIFTPQLLLAPYGCPSKIAYWPVGCLATTIALNVLVILGMTTGRVRIGFLHIQTQLAPEPGPFIKRIFFFRTQTHPVGLRGPFRPTRFGLIRGPKNWSPNWGLKNTLV